jgi:hypothetical protein
MNSTMHRLALPLMALSLLAPGCHQEPVGPDGAPAADLAAPPDGPDLLPPDLLQPSDLARPDLGPGGTHLGSFRFGGRLFDDRITAVAADSRGDLLVTGRFGGTVDFGPFRMTSAGDADAFIARFDQTGKPLWARSLGGARFDIGFGVAVDASDNVYVVGRLTGPADLGQGPTPGAGETDIFLVKYDRGGALKWAKRLGGPFADQGTAVAVLPGGDVVVAGRVAGAVDLGGGPLVGPGGGDTFLVRYDPDGRHVFSRRMGNTGDFDTAPAMAVNAAGQIALTGTFALRADFGGGELQASGTDIFVARFDSGGRYEWARAIGGSDEDRLSVIALGPGGETTVSGSCRGEVDFGAGKTGAWGDSGIFVAQYAAGGALRWARRMKTSGSVIAWGVTSDPDGSVAVAGWAMGSLDLGGGPPASRERGFVVRYAPGGVYGWSRSLESSAGVYLSALGRTRAGALLLGGDFTGTADFGGGPLDSVGERDAFVLLLSP